MNALRRISEKIRLWEGLDEQVTSDTVVENLETCKRVVIEDNRALVNRLRDAETTIYPAFGTAYRAYTAERIDVIIKELSDETDFYAIE